MNQFVEVLRWILNAFYVLIGGASLVMLIKLQRREKHKCAMTKPKMLFLLVILSCVSRIIVDMLPDEWYLQNVETHPILQMILDILPELLFFSCYFFLLVMWIELYYLTKIKDQPKVIVWMWILSAVIIGLIFLAGLLFSIAVGASGPYSEAHLEAEAVFLASFSLILAISFPVGSWFLFRQLSGTNAITSLKKKSMLFKLQRLVIICVLCSLAHMTYTLILEIYFKGLISNEILQSVVWLCYFVITEQVPSACIVYLLSMMTISTSHNTSIKVEGRLIQPLIQEDEESPPPLD